MRIVEYARIVEELVRGTAQRDAARGVAWSGFLS